MHCDGGVEAVILVVDGTDELRISVAAKAFENLVGGHTWTSVRVKW